MQVIEERVRNSRARNRNNGGQDDGRLTTPSQRAFWQAITVGELETMQVLLDHREIDVNKVDELGEQRQGCTALHLAILEMPTWKSEGRAEGRNGIQSAEFVKKFFTVLLEHGADIDKPCQYNGEWYLQTAAGKTKSFFPDGYDALGLVLQFVEITRGAEVISTNVTRRLELIRDLLLEHIKSEPEPVGGSSSNSLVEDMSQAFRAKNFVDVDLVSEAEVIPAHKLVLAARSPVFAAMFGSANFVESRSGRVEIDETDPKTLASFVQFLYEDRLDQDALSAEFQSCYSLIMLSNRYDVKALKVKCAEIILNHHMSIEKAATILKLADQNQVDNLREKTLKFISKNINAVMETKDFKNLDRELYQEVLRKVASQSRQVLRNANRISSTSPPSVTKRSRTMVDVSDEEAVRAPPNNQDEDDAEE